jgi:hypothetical protein
MKKKIIRYFLSSALILLLSCGKKLPPSSPDRWAPHLLNVSAIDEHHISVFFSERLDTLSPRKLENFKLFNPQSEETTSVILSERTVKGDEILLTIPKLKDAKYILRIFNIADLKGNVLEKAEKAFEPSQDKDTISPIIKKTYPSRALTSAPQDSTVFIEFSEPMDSVNCSVNNLILTNITIDTNFVWNKTLTEFTMRYKLTDDKLCRLFILPSMTDLSGNPLGNMRILTFTAADSLPRNRMDVEIVEEKKSQIKIYAFLALVRGGLLEDIVSVDTSFTFSFFSFYPDTYVISVAAQDSSDTTGLWWGEKQTLFVPDTTGSMDEKVEIDFVDRGKIPEEYFHIYRILRKNIQKGGN